MLQSFYQCFGLSVPRDIPQRTTIEDMARELGIICDLHAAEVALSTDHLTLGFDATTQEGEHVNCNLLTTEMQTKLNCKLKIKEMREKFYCRSQCVISTEA